MLRRLGKLDYCYERLGIPIPDRNFENLYDKLIEEITNSYSKTINALSNSTR